MNIFDYLGPFFLLLGVLVFFHELGHFAVAKWLGVACERFAIGFGPPLLRYKHGETEYVLAWLPLGGYVKMLGESPDEHVAPEEARRSFYGQSPLRRTAIALAGPAMNLILSVVVIAVAMMTAGWPELTSRIGSVVPNSAAARAGIQGGDRIVAVDGKPVALFQDLVNHIQQAGESAVAVTVERGTERFEVSVKPEPIEPNGVPKLGVEAGVPSPMLAFPDSKVAAVQAGLRSGDVVTSVQGKPVADFYQLVDVLKSSSGPLAIEVDRKQPGQPGPQKIKVDIPADSEGNWSLARLGSVPVDFLVSQVIPASPAKRAGLRGGELVLSLNGESVHSVAEFEKRVKDTTSGALRVEVLQDGAVNTVTVEPMYGADEEARVSLGIRFGRPETRGETVRQTVRNPFVALGYGVQQTWRYFVVTVESLRRLLTREIGMGNLTGPIGIGEIAAESFAEDILQFLQWMCVISVNLAIINLLPIPVLDGGHILFAGAEAVRGGPLGRRAREVAQTIGLSFVIMLMGLAFWNDLSRSWPRILNFFQGLL